MKSSITAIIVIVLISGSTSLQHNSGNLLDRMCAFQLVINEMYKLNKKAVPSKHETT